MARVAKVSTNILGMVRVMMIVKTWMIVRRRVQLPVLLKRVDRREKILETSLRPFRLSRLRTLGFFCHECSSRNMLSPTWIDAPEVLSLSLLVPK